MSNQAQRLSPPAALGGDNSLGREHPLPFQKQPIKNYVKEVDLETSV